MLPIRAEAAIDQKKVTLGIRPEHVRVAATESSVRLPAVVNIVENLGSENLLHAEFADNQLLVAKIAGGVAPERNHRLTLFLPAEHLYLFDEQENVIPVSPLVTPGTPRPREKAKTP
jgi:ABC-type sugar transport system ATPase subunit